MEDDIVPKRKTIGLKVVNYKESKFLMMPFSKENNFKTVLSHL